MAGKRVRIAVVAPARRLEEETAARVGAFARERYGDEVCLDFHPQCFLSEGHFAGDDAARMKAFVDVANDPDVDAVWFARGGYGAARFTREAFFALGPSARAKTYVGYSDMGFLLGRLYAAGVGTCVHGPMPNDIAREGGEQAVGRALDWLVRAERSGLEPNAEGAAAAFNITVLSHLVGTLSEPDLTDHVLMLEEVGEYHYRIDRALFTIFMSMGLGALKGVRLGRCLDTPENDTPFGQDEEAIVRYWCERARTPYLGRADIGHDTDNKIVVFGGPDARPGTAAPVAV